MNRPRQTASRYLNLLETSYQLVRLVPYWINRTKPRAEILFWRTHSGEKTEVTPRKHLGAARVEEK